MIWGNTTSYWLHKVMVNFAQNAFENFQIFPPCIILFLFSHYALTITLHRVWAFLYYSIWGLEVRGYGKNNDLGNRLYRVKILISLTYHMLCAESQPWELPLIENYMHSILYVATCMMLYQFVPVFILMTYVSFWLLVIVVWHVLAITPCFKS